MITNINQDIFIIVLNFLSRNDTYAIKEINKYFHGIIICVSKYSKNIIKFNVLRQPDIDYIFTSKNLFEWAINHPYFYENKLPLVLTKNGKLEYLQYVLNNGYKYDPEIYYEAAKNSFDNMDIIKWCYKKNFKPNERAIQGACEVGNIELIKWMDRRNFPFNVNACHMAAYYNHIDVLKFLIRKGYPWDKRIYNYAAEKGNIRILLFIMNIAGRDLSMPWWDIKTSIIAAKNNQFNTLKWLRNKRCPWNVDVIYGALECGNIEMVNWCVENGCETDAIINEILN
jgi:hypothetical protein